jgi:RNA polymerase sigma-70 factor (ECF subfamily)
MAAEDPRWREWMQGAQQGDRAQYATLLKAVIPLLRRRARARWPQADATMIEDAVQETLLALHASRHLYDPARPVMPFLFGIMRFCGAEVMRQARRHGARETPIDVIPETSEALTTNSIQEQRLEADTLRSAVARLPEGQRRAIDMMKLQELSLEEASTRTGISIAALKVASHRGMQTLRRLLKGLA